MHPAPEAVVFAGGGNRCYWQGGFYETVAPALGWRPQLLIGCSAGAFVACYVAAGLGPRVRGLAIPACKDWQSDIDWRGLLPGRRRLFRVGDVYRDLVMQSFAGDGLARVKAGPRILIALARPPAGKPVALMAARGIAAYEREKKRDNPVHPQSGRKLGFTPDYVDVATLPDLDALADVLMASATVPPFLPVREIGGLPALDGGLYDNVPVGPAEAIEVAGGTSVVLLSRRYPSLPEVAGRIYVQPSQVIGVNQFTITDGEGMEAAWRLGVADGEAYLREAAQAGGAQA
jgi:predicted acylesterase/phospholipase RssA